MKHRHQDMTEKEIALARKWLGVEDKARRTSSVINAVVGGTITHYRIRLRLAWDKMIAEIKKAFFIGGRK